MPRFSFAALSWLVLAPGAAFALNAPGAITIDGGPLGPLSLTGGADGGFYAQTNAPPGTLSNGAALGNALVELQKTSGLVQFTLETGAYAAQTLGSAPVTNNYTAESALYAGYLSIAPNSWLSLSAGQLSPLVGYEGSQDWANASAFFSEVAATEPGQGRGVEVALNQGKFSATISLTDGYYTGVVNYVQGIGTWTPDSSDSVSIYGGGARGPVGVNAPGAGNALLDNSTLFGAFYTRSQGALTLIPELQVQYWHAVRSITTALFANYTISGPWSVGGFAEYATQGYNKTTVYAATPDFFGYGPGSSLYGASVAPAWQRDDLFTRVDVGVLQAHVTAGGAKPLELQGELEGGVLF